MKCPVTTTLAYVLCLMWVGTTISEFVMIHLVFLVLGVHLGLAIFARKVSLWPLVKAMIKNKERGVVTNQLKSATKS